MKKRVYGVGLIGASPVRPGWAIWAHLGAIEYLDMFELKAVGTSSEESARAASAAFGVPGFTDPRDLIAHPDVDIVVVAVKVTAHYDLVAMAIEAGKTVLCEWPLAMTSEQASILAGSAVRAGVRNGVVLQATMAPSIRYARELIADGYIGEVLATSLTGSGVSWARTGVSGQAYLFDKASGASLLSVPVMHAWDALEYVLGAPQEVSAISAIRNPVVTMNDTGEKIASTTADHWAVSAMLKSGALASMYYRGGVSRASALRWEINGSEGDLLLISDNGNLQAVAPDLYAARKVAQVTERLQIPDAFDFAPGAPAGFASNVARMYAALARDIESGGADSFVRNFDHAVRMHKRVDMFAAAAGRGVTQRASDW